MASRKIEDLVPELQTLFHEFSMQMHDAGLQFIVTCTYRSQDEQDELYARGRTKPGNKVTWTRNSRHTRRTAFDIALVKDGKVSWDIKADVNDNDIADYEEAGEIGESVGLEWGGRWKTPDRPHFQLRERTA